MATKRITREIFDAVVQDKVRKYRLNRDDAIEETLHELNMQAGVSRSTPRPPPERFEDGFLDVDRYGRDAPARSTRDVPVRDVPLRSPRDVPLRSPRDSTGSWREDSRRDSFTGPSAREFESDTSLRSPFNSFSERRRSRSPPPIAKDYFNEDVIRSSLRDRDIDLPRSRDASYTREPEFRVPARRDYSPRRSPPREFIPPPPVFDEFRSRGPREEFDGGNQRFDHPGPMDHEFRAPGARVGRSAPTRGRGATLVDRNRVVRPTKRIESTPVRGGKPAPPTRGAKIAPRGRGAAKPVTPRGGKVAPRGRGAAGAGRGRGATNSRKDTRPPMKDPVIDLTDDSTMFSKFGNQLIIWAGFDSIRMGSEYMAEQRSLFQHDTESCSRAVTAFKCSLKQSYRDYCFFLAKDLRHPAMKSPRIDNDLLNLLVDKRAVKTKNCFFEIIKPFDGNIRRLQTGLMKSIIPLLMACNTYEVRQKSGYDGPGDLSNAFEKNISLCRQALVLLGQTYALATVIRQEKILESMGLQGMAPNPTEHPNLKDSFLFGKEYMTQLKSWLAKSGCQIKMVAAPVKEEKKVIDAKKKVKTDGKDQKAADATIVDTIDKLAEHSINTFKGKTTEKKPDFWFLFDENSEEYKYYRTKLAETQKVKRTVKDGRIQTNKQTPEETAAESLKAIQFSQKVRELKTKLFKNVALAKRRRLKGATGPLKSKSGKTAEPKKESAVSSDLESVGVDSKTKDTAEKLARFVAQMGPEVEQFSKENSESNPEFWFLKDKESPAYKFYQAKVAQFRKTDVKSETPAEVECETESKSPSKADAAKKAAPSRTLPRKRVTALKVGMMPAKRVCHVEDAKVHDPVRIDYEKPKGRAVQKKPEKKDLEFADKKTDKNVGKVGLKEGGGLGSEGAGIKDPVKAGSTSGGEGLGEKTPKKEDTFDSFRQRMMQMYKQKQNN